MRYAIFIFTCCFAGCCPPAFGQGISDGFAGVVRVDTDTGRGSGFVVAKTESQFEVWSNAHVAEPAGKRVVVKLDAGTKFEESFRGVVKWARHDDNHDACKILCDGVYTGPVHRIVASTSRVELYATSGFPYGRTGYVVSIRELKDKDFGSVAAYVPSSISGQSGSPVVNNVGEVIGVVTFKLGEGKNAVGGMLPIDHWSEPFRHVSSVIGFGDFTELDNAPPDDQDGDG